MKQKIKFSIIVLILATMVIGAKDVDLRGMLRSYTGISFLDANILKNEQTIDITLEGWKDMTHLVVNPYAYVGIDNTPEFGIREAYVDLYYDHADIRVGKQAILWGQAEGAFITDVVSPRDMRSFILADFREIRKGVPAIKADYYAGSFMFEGIWIPKFVPSSMPDINSIWMRELSLGENITIKNEAIQPIVSPDFDLEHSEIFSKIRYFGPSISWEVMGGYAWTDEPYVENIEVTVSSPTSITIDKIFQEYGRYIVAGGSLSTTLNNAVVRSEAAVYFNKPFTQLQNTPSGPSVSVIKKNQVQALIGLDWSLIGIDMSGQYILSYIHDHSEGMIDQGKQLAEFSHTLTFRLQDTYLDDKLTAKFFTYVELEPLNALLRPSIAWALEDGVSVEGGAELFIGDEEGTFGSYRENSMGFISLRWYF